MRKQTRIGRRRKPQRAGEGKTRCVRTINKPHGGHLLPAFLAAMSFGRLLQYYWHTLKWLRPAQVYGRVWFRLHRPSPELDAVSARREAVGEWRPCERPASLTGVTSMCFLGVQRDLHDASDWNRSDWPKLWLYNAHYFDDLVANSAEERRHWHRALLDRWIRENPPGHGNGWEPYPTSRRIVNWIKWALAGNLLSAEALHSLGVQARWLRRRLESHLMGNHLWVNGKALVFAGAFIKGEEGQAWLRKGLALLRRELAEQVLPDGGHFERSPMYHALMVEDLLDLIQLAARYPGQLCEADVTDWRTSVRQMLKWLRVMTHPDGEIAFFNDAAMDIAPCLKAIESYASAVGLETSIGTLGALEVLPYSGYVRLSVGPAVLIADVAPLGPDYMPGHGHADTLSFELSLHGRRVLVNGGTSTYEANAERLRQRGTASHNTVIVDDADSSEVWSSFRVARRARVHGVSWAQAGDVLELQAKHDGYRRLLGGITHSRHWQLTSGSLNVSDRLSGHWRKAEARFRFSPGWRLERGKALATACSRGQPTFRWRVQGGTQYIEPGTWHPRFGAAEDCEILGVRFESADVITHFAWD